MASRMMILFFFLMVYTLVLLPVNAEKDWTSKCNKCKCVWSSGKKSADCHNLHFSKIPDDLSSELREIDFSGNPLYELRERVFEDAGLSNIHKLKLANCSIVDVDPSTFEKLQLLIELDLSNNNIKKLDNRVFSDNPKLRILLLSHNKLKQLGSNMFPNMTHLQRIHLDNNRLEVISEDVFGTSCPITHLSLENNRLTFLSPTFPTRLRKLSSIELGGNPWMCDCKLDSFRKLALVNNWITQPIGCQQPERLKGRTWADESVIFACEPKIVEPSPSAVLEIDSVNYTIPCKVEGDPRPSIVWMSNGRSVDTHRNAQKYQVSSSKGWPYWDNLTIISVSYRDRGEYKCIATNPGGSDERNVTVYLRGTDYLGGGTLSSTSMSNTMLLIILLAAGAIILLVVIMLLICCCCKRTDNRDRLTKNHPKEMQEFIRNNPEGRHDDVRITSVNPVSKPPRQHSVPTSVISGGTEVSDAKTKLIDDESIYNGDEDMKLYDYPALKTTKRGPMVDDYKTEHYPPDLLSFPPRATHQISPAGSSASTVADTTRLPPHLGMHSPIHSPPFDHSNNLYRTLPYSRSHSPFASNHSIQPVARVPRPGAYVTIPRRPRSSWSSEPPNMPEIGEPLYDNLGLRTTAKGASALSLNKLDATSPTATPTRTPARQLLSPPPCDTIVEHESPPRPAVTSATLPRNLAAHHRALSPNQFDHLRGSWARSSSDSTASLIPTDGKSPKVPPRPPPKPKKRTSTGPLFEDEGEDGTEV